MTDVSPLTTVVARTAPLVGQVSRHFAGRPSLRAVAQRIIAEQLALLIPGFDADPARVTLLSPLPDPHGAPGSLLGYGQQSLVDLLLQRYLEDENQLWVPDAQFLTVEAGAEYPTALSVDLLAVQGLVNEWGPVLLQAYADSLCQFWSEVDRDGRSNWRWLADYLKADMKSGVERQIEGGALSTQEGAMALVVIAFPDNGMREAFNNGNVPQASLLQVRPVDTPPGTPLVLTHGVVIEGHDTASPSTRVLTYTPFYGVEAFGSREALCNHVQPATPGSEDEPSIGFAFYVPDGDIFETQAQALLEQQLLAVVTAGEDTRHRHGSIAQLESEMDLATSLFSIDTAQAVNQWQRLGEALPDWLYNADQDQSLLYASHLVSLAQVQEQPPRSFLYDIPTIEQYAATQLTAQIELDHPGQPLASLDDVEIHLLTVPNAGLSIVNAGDMVLQDQTITLQALALFHLSGRPRGHLEVHAQQDANLPAWVTVEAIERLIQRADVGGNYIALLRRCLLDDGAQASVRQALFATQIREQLPLLALQLVLAGQSGFTQEGYRLVAQAVTSVSHPSATGVRVCTLAFRATPGRTADPVDNMFVFSQAGDPACVLYRPLEKTPLQQFEDEDALFDAIAAAGELQRSVLAWMSADARALYGQGGFEQPHVWRVGQGSEFEALHTPPPATLALQPIAGDCVAHFYRQSVQALITVADRQSLSSSENRWVAYQTLAWTLFNGLLPILSGPLAEAAWLVQVLQSVASGLEQPAAADEIDDGLIDVLFNIAFVLLCKSLQALEPTPELTPAGGRASLEEVNGSTGPTRAPVTVTRVDASQLNFNWSRSHAVLSARQQAQLHQLSVDRPDGLGDAVPHGPLQGLYLREEGWLVLIEGRYYPVQVIEDGVARIVNETSAHGIGPLVERDELGRWRLDLKLSLRGGGPKRTIASMRAENQARADSYVTMLARMKLCSNRVSDRIEELHVQLFGSSAQPSSLDTMTEAQIAAARLELETKSAEMIEELVRVLDTGKTLGRVSTNSDWIRSSARFLQTLCEVAQHSVANLQQMVQAQRQQLTEMASPGVARPRDEVERIMLFIRSGSQVLLTLTERARNTLRWREQLRAVPVVGPQLLARTNSDWVEKMPLEIWVGMQVESAGLLAMEPVLGEPLAKAYLKSVNGEVRMACNTQASLRTSDMELDARVGVLRSVVSQYSAIQDRMEYFQTALEGRYNPTALARQAELVAELQADAQQQLVVWVREQLKQSRRAHRKADRNVIRTQRYGLVLGRRRQPSGSTSHSIVDVLEPVHQTVIASFQENASGEWLEMPHASPSPATGATATAVSTDLNAAVNKAQALLDGLDKEVAGAWKQSKTARIPAEMQDLLLIHAQRLEAAGQTLETILTRTNATDLPTPLHESAARLGKDLLDATQRLNQEGRAIRIAMIKAQAPRAERVQYLLEQGEVTLHREGARKGLNKNRDFLQEYCVADLDGQPLWYAHFHYASADAAPGDYVRAHLKTVAQRFDGLKKQRQQEINGEQVMAILRSRIEAPLDELFLSV